MTEHERATQDKQTDVGQKHRKRQPESQASFDQSLTRDTGPFSLKETPFHPRMDEHAETLSRIPFAAQRHEFIMRLNNTYGYRYVQRLVESVNAQAKLTVSDPSDVYEQEADRVAEEITRSINTPVQRQAPDEEEELLQGKPLVQRQAPDEEEELLQGKPLVQRQAPDEEEELLQGKPLVQRQTPEEDEELQMQSNENTAAMVANDIETRINSAQGDGQPLAEHVREPMEQAFDNDFSGVRVHTDSEADTLNKELSAKAFTTGQDVFFREGEYSPGSDGGKRLIAHELTHVVQQAGGRVRDARRIQRQLPAIVGDHDLPFHEGLGGHMMARHVGKTVPELMTRIQNNPRMLASSTFTNQATAENAVTQTINANQPFIMHWLANQNTRRLAIHSNIGGALGKSVIRTSANGVLPVTTRLSHEIDTVTVVLIRLQQGNGCRILTGYPHE